MGFGIVQWRSGTAAAATAANPVLYAGEPGWETDTGRFKIGDGTTAWNSLAYASTKMIPTSGAPSNSVGVNGDYAIDTTNKVIYGPKAAGVWPGGVSLQGAQGTQGIQGTAGTNGQGVPTGGATGTYLRKTSATDYATAWQTISNNEITTAMLADIPANSLRGNNTASTADPIDIAFAANTFPARSSSSNLIAQPITDFGLSWLNQASVTAATAALNVATTSAAGLLSAVDKKLIDNLHYDFVADFGGVGNDSTLNDTAIATALSTMPVGASLFFPAGTYRFANEININVDKRITFRGINRYASILKTTSATANLFNKSVAGWYDSFSDLGFQSSVTKTAGAAVAISAGNNVGMNVYRCWMTGMFQGINATGAQSANLSVWSDLDISAITNGGRGILINGSTINVMIHNATINGGAATTSACLEIQASGAVQVTNCDWIQGTNVVLFNATAALGAQACYFTNCFFDQPQGSVVKITGGFTHGRIKFTQCGIAPTGNNHAIEIAGTGAGAVGTSTALPAGISVVDCDIYSANGTNTGAGIRVNGCQDINIQNTRIAGFNGAGGAGVWVTPSANNVTKVRVNGCIIGPNSNLTVTNTVGVQLDAGSSGLAALSITDNTMLGNGTAIVDNSTMAAGATKNINNNPGALAGLQSSFAGATALSATEAVILQIPLPANSIKVGTVFRFQITGTAIVTVTTTARVHIGTAGTTADAQVVATAASAAGIAGGLVISGMVSVTSVGASGAGNGAIQITTGTTTGAPTITATGTFNTAVANFVSVGLLCSAAGHTVRAGTLDIVSPT
jgi:hypothetical protein